MNTIIVVCTIVTSTWTTTTTRMYTAPSEAACHRYSEEHGGYGMVAYYRPLTLPRDQEQFNTLCGTDCIEIK